MRQLFDAGISPRGLGVQDKGAAEQAQEAADEVKEGAESAVDEAQAAFEEQAAKAKKVSDKGVLEGTVREPLAEGRAATDPNNAWQVFLGLPCSFFWI